jgi:hypothetical protein
VSDDAVLPAPKPPPSKAEVRERRWAWMTAGAVALTSLAFALPFRNDPGGGSWAFSFPEGWVAAAACLGGLTLSAVVLFARRGAAARRRCAALSLLGAVVVLGCMIAFAARMMKFTDPGSGSGPGSLLASVLDLAWIFTAVRAHGATARPALRRPAPRS